MKDALELFENVDVILSMLLEHVLFYYVPLLPSGPLSLTQRIFQCP